MFVVTRESGPVLTNGYLMADDNRNAVIIDTPLGIWELFKPIIEEKELELKAILLTHSHWDHTFESNSISKENKIKVYVHQADLYRILEPNKHTVFKLPFTIDAVEDYETISDGDILAFGDIKLQVIHTPGHTEGGVCYVDEKNKFIFTGDTLFKGSIGRTDLPGGDTEQLFNTIRTKIISLPQDFLIYSGHGPITTIEKEIQNNPYVN